MLDITDYTTYDEIRLVIGLSSDEMPDSMLSIELFANSLEQRLSSISMVDADPGIGTLKEVFDTLPIESSRSARQKELYRLTRIFSTYVCAREICVSLPMHTAKIISDGKRSLTRFSPEAVFRDTVQNINGKLSSVQLAIEELNSTFSSGSVGLLKVVEPYIDVVTNDDYTS